jgi:thiol-disulfide isomerase/thioredoxin
MNRRFCTVLTITFCLFLSACDSTDYRDHRGNSGRFADHRGQWIVINYWATWCKPCVEEIPELNHFASEREGEVVLFGVDFDQNSGQQLQEGIEKLGIEFPVLITDPTIPLGFTRPTVLPTTLVFDPDGKLHKTLLGPQTETSLQQAIEAK